MPSVPESHKGNIFRYRTGQIWNKDMAFQRHVPYMPGQPIAMDTRCRLCRGDDSQGHIFGSCMHPDMSKQYIARHDKAMRTVIQAFTKEQCGSHYLIADVGKIERLKDIGVHSKTFQHSYPQTDVNKQGAWTLRWRGVSCRGEWQTCFLAEGSGRHAEQDEAGQNQMDHIKHECHITDKRNRIRQKQYMAQWADTYML